MSGAQQPWPQRPARPSARVPGLCLWLAVGLAWAHGSAAHAQDAKALPAWPVLPGAPAAGGVAPAVPAAGPGWRPVNLPAGKAAPSRLGVVSDGGRAVLSLAAEASYGTLVLDLPAGTRAGHLAWQWRLQQPNPAANLRDKAADDSPLKVCASFELPLAAVPFAERQLLRLARSVSGQDLPAATVCYVWDSRLAAGTTLPNAHSRRMRWMVLRGPDTALGSWQAERRNLGADFLALFGDEATSVPPLKAIVVGADADNTGGRSLAQIGPMALD